MFGFLERHFNILPLSSILGTKFKIDTVTLSLVKSFDLFKSFFPLNQLILAFGFDPPVWQCKSYFLSATSGIEALIIVANKGFTVEQLTI